MTRGLPTGRAAETVLAGSLVCAQATAGHLTHLSASDATFVLTEAGGEDRSCASSPGRRRHHSRLRLGRLVVS